VEAEEHDFPSRATVVQGAEVVAVGWGDSHGGVRLACVLGVSMVTKCWFCGPQGSHTYPWHFEEDKAVEAWERMTYGGVTAQQTWGGDLTVLRLADETYLIWKEAK
jgi:hypothetical protein